MDPPSSSTVLAYAVSYPITAVVGLKRNGCPIRLIWTTAETGATIRLEEGSLLGVTCRYRGALLLHEAFVKGYGR